MPEVGISIEFPSGWRAELARIESRPPLAALRQINTLRIRQTCTIDLFEGFTLSEAADPGSFDRIAEIEVFERPGLTLPVGDAERVFWRYRDLAPSCDSYVAAPAGAVLVGCFGDESPADRWLSIAETIEFPPDER